MGISAYERYIQELEAICIRNSVIEHDSLKGLTLEQKLNFFHRMNDVFRLLDIGGLNLFNGELTFQTYREIAVKQINDEYNKEFDKAVSELRNSETNKRMEELTNDLISGNYFNRIKDYKPKTPLIQRETIVSSDESIGSEEESIKMGTQTGIDIEEEHEITADDFFSQGFMSSMLEDDGSNYESSDEDDDFSDEDSEIEYSINENVGQDVDDLFSNIVNNPDFYGSDEIVIEDDYDEDDEDDEEDEEDEETELSDEDLDSYFSEIEEDSDENEDYDEEDSINSYLNGIEDDDYDEDDSDYDEESEDDSINSYLNGIEDDDDDYEEDEEESEDDVDSYLSNIDYDEEDEDEDDENSEDDIDSYLNNVEYEEEDEYEGSDGYSNNNNSYYQNQTSNKFENQPIKEVKSELNKEPQYKTSFEKEDKSVDRLTNLADSVITRFFNRNKSGGK